MGNSHENLKARILALKTSPLSGEGRLLMAEVAELSFEQAMDISLALADKLGRQIDEMTDNLVEAHLPTDTESRQEMQQLIVNCQKGIGRLPPRG